MYGKPAPKKSGNGWSGWYKNYYFRSLLELSYIINVLERFEIKWESGELKKHVIKYEYEGTVKNYFPDFVINDKYIVECKPKKLWNTKLNKIKREYAEQYCKENGFKYKIIEPKKIYIEKLKKLINDGIVFISKPEIILKIFKNENQLRCFIGNQQKFYH